MTCRTCKHLKVAPDKDGKIRPRKGKRYQCGVEVPPLQPLPACINVSDRDWQGVKWPPSRSWMQVDSGEGCTFHQQRDR